jgi:hypothetical protein
MEPRRAHNSWRGLGDRREGRSGNFAIRRDRLTCTARRVDTAFSSAITISIEPNNSLNWSYVYINLRMFAGRSRTLVPFTGPCRRARLGPREIEQSLPIVAAMKETKDVSG